jgi:small conductance mechanosensitive channel
MNDFDSMSKYASELLGKSLTYLPNIIMAIVVLVVGMKIIKYLVSYLGNMLEKSNFSAEIRPFLTSLLGMGLKVLLVFSVAGMVGIETTSFIAVLGAAAFAVGMALQGSLSNLAAGVMILIFRPYKVGDLVKVSDEMGHVDEIQVFNTIMTTLDNKTIIVPNSTAIGGIITNLSSRKHLRVDIQVPIPYSENFAKVELITLEALRQTAKSLDQPAPFVGIETFDSHSILLTARVYAQTEDYWDVYFEAARNIKHALGKHDISVAYSEGIALGKIAP